MSTKTTKKPAAKKPSASAKKKARVKDIVTYCLPSGAGDAPALVTAVDGNEACLTVFAVTGPYVAHGVTHGTKAGCWH